MSFQIRGGDLVMTLDTETAATGFGWQQQPAGRATTVPRFKLAGVPAAVAGIVVANSTLTVILRGDGVEGKWHLRPGHEATHLRARSRGRNDRRWRRGVAPLSPFSRHPSLDRAEPGAPGIGRLLPPRHGGRRRAGEHPLDAPARCCRGRGLCDHRHRLVRINPLPARHPRRDLEYRGVSGYSGTLVGYRVCERSTVGALRTT